MWAPTQYVPRRSVQLVDRQILRKVSRHMGPQGYIAQCSANTTEIKHSEHTSSKSSVPAMPKARVFRLSSLCRAKEPLIWQINYISSILHESLWRFKTSGEGICGLPSPNPLGTGAEGQASSTCSCHYSSVFSLEVWKGIEFSLVGGWDGVRGPRKWRGFLSVEEVQGSGAWWQPVLMDALISLTFSFFTVLL